MTKEELLLLFRCLVKVVGGIEVAAGIVGCGKSSISNYQLGKPLPPIPVVCALEADVGFPLISSRMLEHAAGKQTNHRPMGREERVDRLLKEGSEGVRSLVANDCPTRVKKELFEGGVEYFGAYLDVEHRLRTIMPVYRAPMQQVLLVGTVR